MPLSFSPQAAAREREYRLGRKPILYLRIGIHVLGAAVSAIAPTSGLGRSPTRNWTFSGAAQGLTNSADVQRSETRRRGDRGIAHCNQPVPDSPTSG